MSSRDRAVHVSMTAKLRTQQKDKGLFYNLTLDKRSQEETEKFVALPAWAVAGSIAYYLWIKPSQDAEQLRKVPFLFCQLTCRRPNLSSLYLYMMCINTAGRCSKT